jgi:2-methylisocitrate lyase-like PEP mutase family enzyme
MLATADAALNQIRYDGHQRALITEMWSRKQLYDLLDYDEAVPEESVPD